MEYLGRNGVQRIAALGGEWPKRARAAAVALVAAGQERDPSLGVRLLSDLRMVFGDDTMMPTKVILRKLAEIEEAPWGDIKGKPLDERGIARRLKEYGIRSKNLKLDAGAVAKGYTRADLFDAWARYLPPSPDNSATTATHATCHPVAAVAQVAHLPEARGQGCDHCGQPGDDADPLRLCGLGGEELQLHSRCIREVMQGAA